MMDANREDLLVQEIRHLHECLGALVSDQTKELRDSLIKREFDETKARLEKAEKSLKTSGFTDEGGELWKPPVKDGHLIVKLLDEVDTLKSKGWCLEAQLREANDKVEKLKSENRILYSDLKVARDTAAAALDQNEYLLSEMHEADNCIEWYKRHYTALKEIYDIGYELREDWTMSGFNRYQKALENYEKMV